MSFERRIALLTAIAVAVAIAVVALAAWLLVRGELRGQIDDSLRGQAQAVRGLAGDAPFSLPAPPPIVRGGGVAEAQPAPAGPEEGGPGPGGPGPFGAALEGPQLGGGEAAGAIIDADGNVITTRGLPDDVTLPSETAVQAIDDDVEEPELSDATVEGESVRLATVALDDGTALVLARSLEETDDSLSQLALILLLVAAGGTAVAAGLGTLVARTAIAPVRTLTGTAEEVARTEDLTQRIEVSGDDELARLGASFNSMLAALESSVGAQRRLVADASHELRTPLTSLRTNIETLMRSPEMPVSDRDVLLAELGEEMEELGRLVDDIVDLAREGAETGLGSEPVDVRLDEVVAACVDRARRRAPETTTITAELEPAVVLGAPERLDRAVGNLLDNALKWTPEGGAIAVEADARGVRIGDSGPGIAEADLPHVFDRFWRAPSARGTPGSGLGLAIVKQVAETHGGSVGASRSELGGAQLELALPGTGVGQDS